MSPYPLHQTRDSSAVHRHRFQTAIGCILCGSTKGNNNFQQQIVTTSEAVLLFNSQNSIKKGSVEKELQRDCMTAFVLLNLQAVCFWFAPYSNVSVKNLWQSELSWSCIPDRVSQNRSLYRSIHIRRSTHRIIQRSPHRRTSMGFYKRRRWSGKALFHNCVNKETSKISSTAQKSHMSIHRIACSMT